VNRAASASRPSGIDPSREVHIMPLAGAETKNRTFMQPPPSAQRSDLVLSFLCDARTAAKGFQILEEVCLRPGFDPDPQLLFADTATSFVTSSLPPSC
jgi:hypothetical protein